MSHDWFAPFPGASRSMPCRLCGRNWQSHIRPVSYGTRLSHNDLIERMGHCDGSCGRHQGRPFGHNDLIRLHGHCDGSCGTHPHR